MAFPDKIIRKGDDMAIRLLDKSGGLAYAISSDRPDCVHVHDASIGDKITIGGEGRYAFRVPYQANIQKAECQLKAGAGYPGKVVVDFGDTVSEKYKTFRSE